MSHPADFASPEDIEHAFYDAVVKGDANQMIELWAEDEDTVCVHPTGVRLSGLSAIRDSWQTIFSSARIRVQAESVAHWQGSLLAIHHLTEVLFVGDDPSPHGPLHVTHVYVRGAHGWRMVSRHASAADEEQPASADTSTPHTLH